MKLTFFPLIALLLALTSALPRHLENFAPTRSDSGRPRERQTSLPSISGIPSLDQVHSDQDDGKESNGSGDGPGTGTISIQPDSLSMPGGASVAPNDETTTPTHDEGGGSGEGSKISPTNHDQYPYSSNCGGLDKWGFNACQCTSFVAWKLNVDGGINFSNRYKNQRWGNANNWDDAARGAGLLVDNNPTIGSIAQSDAGGYGHVAWISGVEGNDVQIEEFNFNGRLEYHTRSVAKGQFKYIHFV